MAHRPTHKSRRAGLTLIELILAMTILTMVIGGVVAFLTMFLGAWSGGEASRDASDRVQNLVNRIRQDLRLLYVEADPPTVGSPARFLCGPDQNRNPLLRLVRMGDPADLRSASGANDPRNLAIPFPYYAPLAEVAYVLDTAKGRSNLWRGVKDFERGGQSFFDDRYLASPAVRDRFEVVDDGVLYIEYRFWTKYTNTWDPQVPPAATPAGSKIVVGGKTMVGPSSIWDSTRGVKGFFLESIRGDRRSSEYVYPSAIQVMIEIEKEGSIARLGKDLGTDDNTAAIENAEDLPASPAFLRIDDEWIEYARKEAGGVSAARRGMRGTAAAKHPVGTPVRFGERVIVEIPLPVHRHQEE